MALHEYAFHASPAAFRPARRRSTSHSHVGPLDLGALEDLGKVLVSELLPVPSMSIPLALLVTPTDGASAC